MDIHSDHNPLVGVFKIRMNKVARKRLMNSDIQELKETSIKSSIEEHLNNELRDVCLFGELKKKLKN